MSMQVVVAKLAGLTGRAAELRQLLTDRATVARNEDGCLGYEVAERLDEPVSFVLVQTWASSETLRAHFSTEERESIRKVRCGVSIETVSMWIPKKSARMVRSAGFGRMSTVCDTSCWPSPLLGSSRSEQRAKLTGLS